MWYFSWILGTAFACSFAVLFGIWCEFKASESLKREKTPAEEKIIDR